MQRKNASGFDRRPLELRWESSYSLGCSVTKLIREANSRSMIPHGIDTASHVIRLLAGAKLELERGEVALTLDHSIVNSSAGRRAFGVYRIENTVLFATYWLTEHLMDACRREIESRRQPIVIVAEEREDLARMLVEHSQVSDTIEVIGLETFLLSGLGLRSLLSGRVTEYVERLVDMYNRIVAQSGTRDIPRLRLGGLTKAQIQG